MGLNHRSGGSCDLLVRTVACRVQEHALGGLSVSTQSALGNCR